MQTFLPYPDYHRSAQVLDMRRLGKQRVEVLQILKALLEGGGWQNHPATKMWRGHEANLAYYGLVICDEWISRGYKDSCRNKILEKIEPNLISPPWVGDMEFHLSHQSNLLRKDFAYYAQFFPDVPDNLEYIWPVSA